MKISRKKHLLGLALFATLISIFVIGKSFSFAEDPANNMNISVETKWIGFISSNMKRGMCSLISLNSIRQVER